MKKIQLNRIQLNKTNISKLNVQLANKIIGGSRTSVDIDEDNSADNNC
ncbi:class I lanthipeptide [Kordia sp.]